MQSPLFIQQIFTVPGTGKEQKNDPRAHGRETSDKIKHTERLCLVRYGLSLSFHSYGRENKGRFNGTQVL
jgi:hypothetical protein